MADATIRVVGAGLPRTGTTSLKVALESLLDGRCLHMSNIPGHPFDLGEDWQTALAGGTPDWRRMLDGYVASDDWPASMFWREQSEVFPDALIVLSSRTDAATWYESVAATILPVTRPALAPDFGAGRDLLTLMERFAGTEQWDDPDVLMAAYDHHNLEVRTTAPSNRLLEWQVADGWAPLCTALELPVPDEPFPWVNKREDWGAS